MHPKSEDSPAPALSMEVDNSADSGIVADVDSPQEGAGSEETL